MFPFSPFPGRGHPAWPDDAYDMHVREEAYKGFRRFIFFIAFVIIAVYCRWNYLLFGDFLTENFFQKEFYLSDTRLFLFQIVDKITEGSFYLDEPLSRIIHNKATNNGQFYSNYISDRWEKVYWPDHPKNQLYLPRGNDMLDFLKTNPVRNRWHFDVWCSFSEFQYVPFEEGPDASEEDLMMSEVLDIVKYPPLTEEELETAKLFEVKSTIINKSVKKL